MSDETEIDVVVEADASQAVSSTNAAADAILALLGNVQQLEVALRRIFTNDIPEGMDALRQYAERIQSVQGLPASPRTTARTVGQLASGGPATAVRTAAFQGVLQNLRADPALQLQQYERQAEQLMQARRRIFERVRASNPEDALGSYRQALTSLGDRRVSSASWMAETEAEVRTFNERMAEQISQTYQRSMRRALPQVFQVGDEAEREARARAAAERISSYAQRRGQNVSPDDLYQVYAQEAERRTGQDAVAERRAEQARTRREADDENRQRDRNDYIRDRYTRGQAEEENRQRDRADTRMRRDADGENARYDRDDLLAARYVRGQAEYENRERTRQAKSERSEATTENRQRDRDYVARDRFDRTQAQWEDRAPAQAANLERQIVTIEERINQLRERGNAEQRESVGLLEQEIARLREVQAQYLRVGGAQEAASVERARRTRLDPLQQTPEQRQAQAEQAVQRRLEMREAQLNYRGGAAMFGVEAHTLANYAVMGGAIGAAGYAGQQVVGFQSGLDGIKSEAGATDTQMGALARDILAVGSSSNHALKDLTDATELLVRAGYNTQAAGEMLRPIGQLATATRSNVKDAADVTTEVMKTFNMAASQAPMVTNALAEISTHSKVSLDDMGKAFKTSGEFAIGAGVQFNEVLAAFGAMAQAGMKDGSQLGSGLKALIEALDNPTTKLQAQLQKVGLTAADVSVQSNGLGGALENLQSHGFTAADAMSGLQARAFQAYGALSQNLQTYDRLDRTVLTSSAATDVAGARMQGFTESWQRLLNVLVRVTYEGAAPLLRVLAEMMSGLANVVGALSGATPAITIFGTALGALGIAFVTTRLAALAGGLLGLPEEFSLAAVASLELSGGLDAITTAARGMALALLATPLGAITTAITIATLAFEGLSVVQGRTTEEVNKYGQAASDAAAKQQEYQSRMSQLDGYITSLVDRHDSLARNTNLAGQAAEVAAQKFGAWGLQITAQTRNVDGLIAKLGELRQAQAAAALESAKSENANLESQNTALGNRLNGVVGSTRSSLMGPLTQALSRPVAGQAGQVLSRLWNSGIDPTQIQSDLAVLRGANNPRFASVISALEGGAGDAAKMQENTSRIAQNNQTIGTLTVQTGPQYSEFQRQANAERVRLGQRAAALQNIQDPEARIRARADLETDARGSYGRLQTQAQSLAKGAGQDPQTAGQALSTLMGNSSVTDIADLGGVEHAGMTQREWRRRATMLRAQARNAKTPTDRDHLLDQAKQADIGALGPNASLEELEDVQGTDDARAETQRNADGRRAAAAGRRGDRNEAGTDQRDMTDLLKAMQSTASQAPDRNAVQPQLRQMGDQYIGMARQQATLQSQGQGLNRDQLQRRVQDAVNTATDSVTKIIEGNLSAAAKVVADAAERSATSTSSNLNAAAQSGKAGGIGDALGKIQDGFAKAADAKQQQLIHEYEERQQEELDLSKPLPATLTDEIETSTRSFQQKSAQATISFIQAFYEGAARAQQLSLEGNMRNLDRQQAQLSAVHNPWGQANLSDVHGWTADQASKQLDVQKAQLQLNDAGRRVVNNQSQLSQLQAQQASAPEADRGSFDAPIQAATKSLQEAKKAAEDAQNTITQLSAKTQPFATASEAISAAWNKFSQDAKLSEGPYEQLADGFNSFLNASNQGLQGLFTNLTSGTMKSSQAFKQLGLTIFQSIQQAAAKALSNALIKQLFNIGASLIPGFGGGAGTGANAADNFINLGSDWQGGIIRQHFVQGGIVGGDINTRDSVPTELAPGEGVLNQDAMSMLGTSTFNALNAAGNRVSSQMPSVKDAMPQRPADTTNVWVVSPDQKPQMSGKDVVATIGQDILQGGQTKQLIKAVVAGQA